MDYYFMVVFLQCCSLSSVLSASTIILSPHGTDAFVGGNVTLYCSVQDLGGNTVVWRNSGSGLTTEYSENRKIVAPQEIQPSRYTIIGDDAEGTFNLEITGIIAAYDSREYQCVIKDRTDEILQSSEVAALRVHEIPRLPTCSTCSSSCPAPEDLVEGDSVVFECKLDNTIPQVELNLTRYGNTLPSTTVDPDQDRKYSTSSTLFNVTSEDNGAMLRCSVDHPIFSMPYECSVTLNVMYKPIVEITQTGVQSKTASFTCDAVSNPNVTQFNWSLCLRNTDNDSIYLDNGTQLTIERRDLVLEEPITAELEDFGSNVSCYNCTNAEIELPVLVFLTTIEKLTIPENKTVIQCSLKCSVSNSIGEGRDEYNTVCVIENNSIIIILYENGRGQGLYYYIIGGLIGCTVIIFICTMTITIIKTKTAPVEGSVTVTQMAQYSNNGCDENGGNQKDNMYSENPIKRDEKEGNIPSKNPSESTPEKDDASDAHGRDALPMDGDSRRKPERDVDMDAADGDGDAVAIPMGAAPLYAVVNKTLKSSGRGGPPPDILQSDGVKYTSVDFSEKPQSKLTTIKGTEGSTAYAGIDYSTQP